MPRKTHGQTWPKITPEYRAYIDAKSRCNNPNNSQFKNYGERGIEMRFKSFEEFFADIGPKPSPKLSLHRVNNDAHYERGNIIWADWTTQARNKRCWRNVIAARERISELVELYKAGVSQRDLAARFEIGKRTIHQLLREQNCINIARPKPKACSSRFRGVSWHKKSGKWTAYVNRNKKFLYLGLFDTELAAYRARSFSEQL
jgi:hypothetical protein